jgi:glycosyltransferase involved in cell wall biosynthesis
MRVYKNYNLVIQPIISILIPTLHCDPSALIVRLAEISKYDGIDIEVIILDDGSCDDPLTDKITSCLENLSIFATLLTMEVNRGRAAGRNTLAQHAKGKYILFLDADTMPDHANFIKIYHDEIVNNSPVMLIGGFTLKQVSKTPVTRLHHYITGKLDCLPAKARQEGSWRYCFGCNVLIRRDVVLEFSFNEVYRYWGWEDQEWGMRIAQRYAIRHIDNTVSHLGLDDEITLKRKYAESGKSFLQILGDHPHEMRQTSAYWAYAILGWMPFHKLLIAPVDLLTQWVFLPLSWRARLLRVYRALHY